MNVASSPAGRSGPRRDRTSRAAIQLSSRYEHAVVHVTARRPDAPPKFTEITYVLRLATSEPQRRIDLLHRNLRRYGTVYNTLGAACDVQGTVPPPRLRRRPAPRAHPDERRRQRPPV